MGRRSVGLWEDLRHSLKTQDMTGLLRFSRKRLTHSICHMPSKHKGMGISLKQGLWLFSFVFPEPSAHATFWVFNMHTY